MQKPDVSDEIGGRLRKLALTAAASVGVVVLGAIGSGLWDRLGSPFLDAVVRAIITAIDALIGTYKDSIYREASYGFHEKPASILYSFVWGIVPVMSIAIVALALIVLRDGNSISVRTARTLRVVRSRLFLYGFLLYTISSSAIFLSRHAYVRGVVVYAESSIDRLAPYLYMTPEVMPHNGIG